MQGRNSRPAVIGWLFLASGCWHESLSLGGVVSPVASFTLLLLTGVHGTAVDGYPWHRCRRVSMTPLRPHGRAPCRP
eukprot:287894-Chlamydomonas_euryale.AAC.3